MKKLIGQKWFRQIFQRRVLIILMLLVQIWFLISLISNSSQFSRHINRLLTLVSFLVALYIISKKEKSAYKLTWIFLILLFPLFGGFMYLLFNYQTSVKHFAKRINEICERTTTFSFRKPDMKPPHWTFMTIFPKLDTCRNWPSSRFILTQQPNIFLPAKKCLKY